MKHSLLIHLLLLAFAITSCDGDATKNKNVVARAYDKTLSTKEVEKAIGHPFSAQDSTNKAKQYVDRWLRRQVMLHKAEQHKDINEEEINRQLEEHREQLLTFELKRRLIEQELSKELTENEITDYYDEHPTQFILKDDIFKGRFLKIRNEAPKADLAEEYIQSEGEQGVSDLRSYATRFAEQTIISDSAWVKLDDVAENTPFQGVNPGMVLQSNELSRREDSTYTYYLYVTEYARKNSQSPLDFCRQGIANALLNIKKKELLRTFENEAYQKALMDNNIEILR